MKKLASCLLIFAMLISIIYIPAFVLKGDAVVMPDGSTMTAGKTTDDITGFTPITKSKEFQEKGKEDFGKIEAGGKYYLTTSLNFNEYNSDFETINLNTVGGSKPIILDGRGYTITTPKALFRALPPGSVVRNLVIAGTISDDTSYDDYEYSYGALAWRCYGAHIKNVINNAKITYTREKQDNIAIKYIRVGGLVGSVVSSGYTLFENCINNGAISGSYAGSGKSGTICGVGGIVGYIRNDAANASFLNCKNTGNITNNFKTYSYAGGIVGAKHADGKMLIIMASNSGTITLGGTGTTCKKATYCPEIIAQDPNREVLVTGVNAISTPEEFAAISGNGSYYLANDITVDQNDNDFNGRIYGFRRTITSTESPFSNMLNFTHRDLYMTLTDWQRISTADEFLAINNDGSANTDNKYYLGASFSLPDDWAGPAAWSGSDENRVKATNNQPNIILEGCGFTITTTKPIFTELPGGGVSNDGTHSVVRNLKIAGSIFVNKTDIATYNNGDSVGALVGKANGGIYENIVNDASVKLNGEAAARVGGIVGSTFSDDITMINCVNNGTVQASISGNVCGVGGIIGLIGYNTGDIARGVKATFRDCINNGSVRNVSDATAHVYAGGITAVKYRYETVAYLYDCYNNGSVFAKTSYGNYCADRLQQNLHIMRTK